jgi:hypothetical protein
MLTGAAEAQSFGCAFDEAVYSARAPGGVGQY